VDEFAAWPPYEEMLTVVADHPHEAMERVLLDGKGPTDPSLRYVSAVWFNHNGRPCSCGGWIGEPLTERRGTMLVPMPPLRPPTV
jgi:hypothetical protein